MRHPGVDAAIERDFAAMVTAAQLLPRLMPATAGLRLDDTLKQFAAPLREQVGLGRARGGGGGGFVLAGERGGL